MNADGTFNLVWSPDNIGTTQYPEAGGFALEGFASLAHPTADRFSWPTTTGIAVFGGNANQLVYTAGTTASSNTSGSVGGMLRNNTGADIDLTNGRVDVDISITEFNQGSAADSLLSCAVSTSSGVVFLTAGQDIAGTGVFTFTDITACLLYTSPSPRDS